MTKGQKWLVTILSVALFLLLFGRMLFAFCFLPLKDYCTITVPDGRYVSWEEIHECPADIESSQTAWFDNCLLKWQRQQLVRYMKKNNYCIAPGEYHFYSTDYGDELLQTYDYVDADTK